MAAGDWGILYEEGKEESIAHIIADTFRFILPAGYVVKSVGT